jgi:hypothetical protein
MNSSMTDISPSSANYSIIAPMSMVFALIGVFISSIILILIFLRKQLHSVTYLLICNTCVSSILYCIVQCNNYIYLLFITWDTSDMSCRWRGYFSYLSIVAVVYSYLLQATSRLFFSVLSTKYPWLISFKTHLSLILIEWMIVLIAPLPALVTKDIHFRLGFLCWVPMKSMLHVVYTILVYYIIPTVLIVAIYITIYVRIRRGKNNAVTQKTTTTTTRKRKNRDLEVFRNIMILFLIYILGGTPSALYILTGVELFYSIGVVSVTLAVTVEKAVSILLDREIRNIFKNFCCHSVSKS